MNACYNYTCPNCSQECSVEEELTGQNVVCPHCSQEFFATPPTSTTQPILPEKLPFFKSGRKKILAERMDQLIADGEMSNGDQDTLNRTAIMLGLDRVDLQKMVREKFMNEFLPIQRRKGNGETRLFYYECGPSEILHGLNRAFPMNLLPSVTKKSGACIERQRL